MAPIDRKRQADLSSVLARVSGQTQSLVVRRAQGQATDGIAKGSDHIVRLWAREMPTGVYDPKWLPCRTPTGVVPALAFTLSRSSPNYTGEIDDSR